MTDSITLLLVLNISSVALMVIVFTAITSVFMIPAYITVARYIGLVDAPNARKIHKEVTPLVGGIALMITLLGCCLMVYFFELKPLWTFLICSVILFLLGSIDDRFDISAKFRLFIEIAVSITMIHSGYCISSFYGIFGIYELSTFWTYGFNVFLIVGCLNAINLLDGIDGLLGGFSLIALSFFALLSIFLKEFTLLVIYLGLLTSLFFILRLNLSEKNKIFLGDSGSLLLGFIITFSGIHLINVSSSTANINTTVFLVFSIMALPVFDALRVFYFRIRKGKSPMKPDKSHIHHFVLKTGLNHKKSAFLILVCMTLYTIIGFVLLSIFSLNVAIFYRIFAFVVSTYILYLNSNRIDQIRNIKRLETRIV